MSYTFGGATGDDINWTGALSAGADNTSTLVCGWWYPTTLTATRRYWSAGTIYGAEVDAGTSEIRMRTDNTTDGQWLTSGAGITTDKWHFIAWLNAAENTTVAGAWRVWVGDAETAPTEKTVTNPTTRSGNYTGSAAWTIGNAGSAGSVAWQGDIGWMVGAAVNNFGVNNPLGVITSGTIADTDALRVYNQWVLPLWLGQPDASHMVTPTLGTSFSLWHAPLQEVTGPLVVEWSNSVTTFARRATTVNGAVYSDNLPPKRLPHDWPTNLFSGRRR